MTSARDPLETAHKLTTVHRARWLKAVIPLFPLTMSEAEIAAVLNVPLADIETSILLDKKKRERALASAEIFRQKLKFTDLEIASSGLTGTRNEVTWAMGIRRKSGASADAFESEKSARFWINNRHKFQFWPSIPAMSDLVTEPLPVVRKKKRLAHGIET